MYDLNRERVAPAAGFLVSSLHRAAARLKLDTILCVLGKLGALISNLVSFLCLAKYTSVVGAKSVIKIFIIVS